MPGVDLYGFDNDTGDNISESASSVINRVPVIAGGVTRTIGEHLAYANAFATKTATVLIPAWCAVVADGPLGCRPADPTNPAHAGAVIGVSAEGAGVGLVATIRAVGEVVGSAGAWNPGDILYVGAGGTLSPTPPAAGWVLIAGKAIATNRVIVNTIPLKTLGEQTYSLAQGNITAGQASIVLSYTPGFVHLFYSTPGGAALDITSSCVATDGASITLPSGGFPGGAVVLTVRAETVAQGINATPAQISVGGVTKSVADHLVDRPLTYKRPFASARSRTPAERLDTSALNVLDYIAPAQMDGATNVAAQVAACVADARSAGIRRVIVPSTPAPIVLNGPAIDISGLTIEAEGGGYGPTARIATSANTTMFVASGNGATLRGLFLEHHGPNGLIFSATNGSEGHNVQDCSLVADGAGATDTMVVFTGSNSYIRDCQITNTCPDRYSVLFQRIPDSGGPKLQINSGVDRCYFGGTGKGVGIGSTGGAPRPEGIVVSGCNSVLTGGPFVEVSDILSLRIINNMIDQGSAQGAIRLAPTGTGILGVQIIGNYISSVAGGSSPAAVAILHVSGAAGLQGLLISGNEIAYSQSGINIASNASKVSVTANWFHDITNTISCSQATSGQVYFDESNMLGAGIVGLTTV